MALSYLPIALILVVLTFLRVNGYDYYVASDVADCDNIASCNTLSYYANTLSQEYSDSIFYFFPGTHLLQQTWIIEKARNLTLTGRSPNSEEDEEVVVECTNSSTDQGIQVINGRNIVVKNMEISNCYQHADSTSNLELSNLTMNFATAKLVNCTDFLITDSVFANSVYGIEVAGSSSGKLSSIKLLNNQKGIVATDDTKNLTTLQMEWIYASNNSFVDFHFIHCSADISLLNSTSDHSGGFLVYQWCPSSLPATYAIKLQQCNFTALSLGILISVSQAPNIRIELNSCLLSNFSGNHWFPALFIYNDDISTVNEEAKEVNCTIHNVTIRDIHRNNKDLPVLFVYTIQNVEISNFSVLDNGHGGLALVDSVAAFRGKNTFCNNSGTYGGGVALYGNSYMFMESNTTLKLINNKAEKFGGGIFVSQDQLWADLYCFIQFHGQLPNITMQGNTAGYAGSQLYGGNIDDCQQVTSSELSLTKVLGLPTNASNCNQSEVSSDAVTLKMCDQGCINSATCTSFDLFPGTKLNLSVAAVGQRNGLTPATVVLKYDEVFHHDEKEESQLINATCTNISRDIRVTTTNTTRYINLTLPDNFVRLTLTDGFISSASTNKPIAIAVHLLPCPPGFSLSERSKTCVCSKSISNYSQCDITSRNITRYDTSWIYPTNKFIKFSEHCPFDYCNTESFSVDNPDGQCDNSRSGILCGECLQGYSLTLGSNKCMSCTNEAWELPVILLVSYIAGFVLVAVLLVLNLTVSVGTINGLLFFVNAIKIYESVLLKNLYQFWNYLFSWLNLDLGKTMCFYEGMDACQKVGLQFVFPIYLLLLVMAIVALCRCGQWIGLRSIPLVVTLSDKTALLMGSKIIPVLATLLLFSYTKLIRAIILIYHKVDMHVFDCNPNISDCGNHLRWYVNGSVEYLTGCHSVLFGLGTAIIVPSISLFTAFLLFFPLMERYLPRFKFWSSWHMRLKPFYDAYGGPYKDEYRFWTGLLLLVRCLLVVVVTVSDDPNVALSVLTWVCLILIPMVALLQVYKSSILNALEIIYLSIILAMVFLYSAPQSNLQLSLSLSISLGLLLAILIFHTGQRIKSTQLAVFLWQKVTHMRNKPSINEQEQVNNKDEDHGCRSISVSTISVPNFTELREPLLFDSS